MPYRLSPDHCRHEYLEYDDVAEADYCLDCGMIFERPNSGDDADVLIY
jgi:hypothetical protein